MQISYWEGTKTHGWRVTDWMCRGLTWPLYTFKPNQRLHNWHLHNSTLLADQFMLLCFNPNDHSCKYNSWHLHRAARGLLFLRSHLQHILKTCTSTKKVFKRYSILISSVRSSNSHPDLLVIHPPTTPLFQITPVLNTGLSLSEPLQLYKGYNAI